MAAVSSAQSATGAAWGQMQLQQAQRNAEQAEVKARALASQARAAESEAARAQENARNLRVESTQANSQAAEAQRGVVEMKGWSLLSSQFSGLQSQIKEVLQNSSTPTTTTAAATPVVNAYGQETGTVVNVTA